MLKRFGKQFAAITNYKLIIYIVGILFVVEIIRVYVLMPLLIFFMIIELANYQGIKYYEDENYLEFEKGELFIDSFHSYDFVEKCDVKEFYYRDNLLLDSFIYGKHHDVYMLDFVAGADYETVCEFIIAEGDYNNELNDFQIYRMPCELGDRKDCFFFAFNDETHQIRYVLVTEIKGFNKDAIIRDIVQVFIRNSEYW